MGIFTVHFHTLKNTYSQSVRIVLTLVFVVTFVFCSVVFTIAHSFVKRGHTLLEQELGARISWSGMYLHPWGGLSDVSVFAIRFLNKNTQEDIVNAKMVFLDFEIRKYILNILKTFNADDTTVKKSRALLPVSYLSLLSIRGGIVNYAEPHRSFYDNVTKKSLLLKQMPYNAIITVENSHLNVLWNDYSINSTNVAFTARLIRATTSITFDIGSALTVQSRTPTLFLRREKKVQIDLASRVMTNDFFKNITIETRVHSASMGDILKLQPFTMTNTVTSQYADFFMQSEGHTIAQGAFDREKKIFTTKVKSKQISLDSLVTFPKKQHIFSELSGDPFFIQGNFLYNARNSTMNYTLGVHNTSLKKNYNDLNAAKQDIVNIQIHGNESLLSVEDITIKAGKNFLSWQGSLALKTMSPNGKINLAFDKFIMNTSLHGTFVLTQDRGIVRGKTEFLTINTLSQPELSLIYDPMKKSVHFFLNDNEVPVFALLKSEIINQWQIILNALPLKLAAPFLPSVYRNHVNVLLDDVFAKGEVLLSSEGGSNVNTAEYSLELFAVKENNFHARLDGLYSQGVWSVKNALFSFPTLHNTIVTADGTYDSTISRLRVMTRVKNSQYKDTFQYEFIGGIVTGKNIPTWELSVNKKTKFSIEGWGPAFMQKRIQLEVKSLLLPIGNFRIKNTLIRTVYHENSMKQLNGTVHVTKSDTKQFMKAKFRLIDEEIRISSLHVTSAKKAINARGKITKKDDLWNISLRRYSANKKTKFFDAEKSWVEFINGTYNTSAKELFIALRNINTQVFVPHVSGFINADFFALSDLSRYEISLRESTVIVNTVPTIVSGSMRYEDNAVSFRDVFVQHNSLRFHVSNMRMKDAKDIFGTYSVSLDTNENMLVRGAFDFALKERLNYSVVKTRTVPHYDGIVTMEVHYASSNETQNPKYVYAFTAKNTAEVFSIVESKNRFFVHKKKDGAFEARIGGLEEHVYITFKGKVLKELLDIHVNIMKANFAPLFGHVEFFRNVNVNTLDVTGRFSIRGTPLSPVYYGFLEAIDTEFRIDAFSKKIIIPKIMILFSEDTISITNTKVNIGSGRIDVIGKGHLVNYGVQDLNINMNIDKQNSVRVRKLSIGKINLTGSLYGSMSVMRTTPSAIVEIDGYVYLSNTDVVFERGQKVKGNFDKSDRISVNITIHSNRGVVFIMPSINFPVLQGYLADNQRLRFTYDANIQSLITDGTVNIQGGQVYYFNKAFIITESVIKFDEQNPINSPHLVTLAAQRRQYYRGSQYTLQLAAENTKLLNMKVALTANPFLSSTEIARIIGNENLHGTHDDSLTESSDNAQLLTGLVSVSDPLSNIGVFSQFEQLLRRSLQLDYIAFNTKIAQRILEYSLDREEAFRQGLNSNAFSDAVPYFFTGSSLEIGKYLKDLYVSFALTINNNSLFTNIENVHTTPAIGVNTVLNVELPTPVFNVRWSFDPTLLFNTIQTLPISFLTISYQLQY